MNSSQYSVLGSSIQEEEQPSRSKILRPLTEEEDQPSRKKKKKGSNGNNNHVPSLKQQDFYNLLERFDLTLTDS